MQRGGLYIHVPFCHAKCFYCDFYSLSATEAMMDDFVDALLAEWQMRRHELHGLPVTVYLGGGTPSALGIPRLRRILSQLPLDEAVEVTVEANPEDVTPGWARELAALGVNRVSMGVQSLNDPELRAIGRRHSSAEAIAAVDCLRQEGISNISLDLIYGLPGQSLSSWQRSLDGLLALRPEHLSAYALSYEEGTRLTALLRRGMVTEVDDDIVAEMYEALCRTAGAAGYDHYEISNFALPGRRAIHNSSYWTMAPYLGIGPAAHSFDGLSTRRANPGSIRRWLKAIGEGQSAYEEEREDTVTLHNDRLMTALRTADGIPATPAMLQAAAPHLANATMTLLPANAPEAPSRLRITEKAWLTSDPIIASLLTLP